MAEPTLSERLMRVALLGVVPADDQHVIADADAEIERLERRQAEAWREVGKLQQAIKWALGEEPDRDDLWFSDVCPEKPRGPYWWRKHLREIAGFATFAYDEDRRTVEQEVKK